MVLGYMTFVLVQASWLFFPLTTNSNKHLVFRQLKASSIVYLFLVSQKRANPVQADSANSWLLNVVIQSLSK